MNLFNFFRRGSAPIARERLQILLAHERNAGSHPDLLGVLREEILAVIGRHVSIEPDKVQIKMDRGKSVSTLAVDIEIPNRDQASDGVPRYSRMMFDAGRDDGALELKGSRI
jgi:cell division topological specificity factor